MKIPDLNFTALKPARLEHQTNITISLVALVAILLVVPATVSRLTDINVLPPLIALLCVTGLAGLAIYFYTMRSKQRDAQLQAFATANNLTYISKPKDPNYPGLIFQQGSERELRMQLTIPTDGKPLEIANYSYVTGSGKNRKTYNYGIIRIKLPRRLPNMVLDAKANNLFGSFSNLPTGYNKDQVLSLEGDFDQHFTLYAPKEYERDALYVFTPDVMQALIDHAGNYDVEVVDDDLFLYASQSFSMWDAAKVKELLGLAQQLDPEFHGQTKRYSDERVADRQANVVSEPGRRLKRGFGWGTLLVVAAVATFGMLDNIIRFVGGGSPVVQAIAVFVPFIALFAILYFAAKKGKLKR